MAELVAGKFNDASPELARQKALAAAAERAGKIQGYMGNQTEVRPEYDWQQKANDTGIQADTIVQESAINAGNNTVIQQVNQAIAQQQAEAQAALDAQAATLNTGGSQGTESPRISAYLRALRKSNNMDANDRTLDGQLGTYGMSADVLRNKQGGEQGGWDQQALGRDISPEEFLNSRKLQNQIARYKFGKYLKKGGEASALTKWQQKTSTDPSDSDALQQFLAEVMSQLRGGA